MHQIKDAIAGFEAGRSVGIYRYVKPSQTLNAILALLCLFTATSSHSIKCIQAGYTAEEGAIVCHPSYINPEETREYAYVTWPSMHFEPPGDVFSVVSGIPFCGEITGGMAEPEIREWGVVGINETQRTSILNVYDVTYHREEGPGPRCSHRGTGSIVFKRIEKAYCPEGFKEYGWFYEHEGGDGTFVCGDPLPAKECKKGNPVDIFSGNKLQDELHIASYGNDGLTLSWHYNHQSKPTLIYLGPSVSQYPLLAMQKPVWMNNYEKRLNFNSYGIRPVLERVNPLDANSLYLVKMGENNWVDALGVFPPQMEERTEEPVERWKYTDPNGNSEFYDPQGRLVKQLDDQGRATSLSYTNDRLTRVSNWKGQTFDFTYDANGVLESVTDCLGYKYRYQFNGDGLLVSVSFPDETPDDDTDNPTRSYRYEHDTIPHALTSIIDENGQVAASWTYDDTGRAISSSHAGGADTITFSYGDSSTTVTNALGKETTYHYSTVQNAHGVVFKNVNKIDRVEGHPSTHCAGANTDYEYDPNGYVTKKTDWNGNVTTYRRDAEGRELSRTEVPYTSELRTISTTWDITHNKPWIVTEAGFITEYTYDDNGRLLTKTQREIND